MDIDRLINRRERLTRSRYVNLPAVADIDAQLAEQFAPGERNDIDLLLGRSCAVLPERPAYFVSQAVTVDEVVTMADALLEQYEAMSAGQPDGMVEHDDWQAG